MPFTPVLDLPDAQLVLREILLLSGVPVASTPPTELKTKVPCLTCYRSGGNVIAPKLADRPLIHVIAWGGSYDQARDLAQTVRSLIFRAWRTPTVSALGRIGWVDEVIGPVQVATGTEPYDVWRFDADYRVIIRPPS